VADARVDGKLLLCPRGWLDALRAGRNPLAPIIRHCANAGFGLGGSSGIGNTAMRTKVEDRKLKRNRGAAERLALNRKWKISRGFRVRASKSRIRLVFKNVLASYSPRVARILFRRIRERERERKRKRDFRMHLTPIEIQRNYSPDSNERIDRSAAADR